MQDLLAQVRSLVARRDPASILLIHGRTSLRMSGADVLLQAVEGRVCNRFDAFSPNPELHELRAALELARSFAPKMILAVGGGSALDLAKGVKGYLGMTEDLESLVKNNGAPRGSVPLVVVPTTAGTGSEVTQFAAIYIEGEKYSIDAPGFLPDEVILDPSLILSAPVGTLASCALDALCQAIESFWAVRSTEESRAWALEAIRGVIEQLPAVGTATDLEWARKMQYFANLAGKAINISRTTLPHAISYVITSRFDVPHGRAVAMTLPSILELNARYADLELNDPRGKAYLEGMFTLLFSALGGVDAAECSVRLREVIRAVGCASSLSEAGLNDAAAKSLILDNINETRAKNNPVKLDRATLEAMFN